MGFVRIPFKLIVATMVAYVKRYLIVHAASYALQGAYGG